MPDLLRREQTISHSMGRGWQREGAAWVEEDHREFQVSQHSPSQNVLCCVLRAEQAVAWPSPRSRPVLSCGSTPISSASCSSVVSTFPSPSSRFCRCGRPLDPCGHDRAACARAGVLGRCGFTVESAAARTCREAGARVTTNIFVRDLDLGAPIADARRLEVVADGLPLHGGRQLAIDTTLVSTLKSNGEARRRTADFDGAALEVARCHKGGPTQPR